MKQAILHLGSNLGDRQHNLSTAIETLQDRLNIIRRSSLYSTAAWGHQDQEDFLNQAVLVETTLTPIELLDFCTEVGAQFPEKEGLQWGPRYMDIDIIFYNDEIINSHRLKIPHPRLHLRNFVLIPLLEIVPDYIHPIFQKTIEELFIESKDPLEVILVEEN